MNYFFNIKINSIIKQALCLTLFLLLSISNVWMFSNAEISIDNISPSISKEPTHPVYQFSFFAKPLITEDNWFVDFLRKDYFLVVHFGYLSGNREEKFIMISGDPSQPSLSLASNGMSRKIDEVTGRIISEEYNFLTSKVVDPNGLVVKKPHITKAKTVILGISYNSDGSIKDILLSPQYDASNNPKQGFFTISNLIYLKAKSSNEYEDVDAKEFIRLNQNISVNDILIPSTTAIPMETIIPSATNSTSTSNKSDDLFNGLKCVLKYTGDVNSRWFNILKSTENNCVINLNRIGYSTDSSLQLGTVILKIYNEKSLLILPSSSILKPNVPLSSDTIVPVIRNGRTFLPIRSLIEELGGSVDWNHNEKTANILINGSSITLRIASKVAKVNGYDIENDVAPYIENGRTMLPLKFILENIGCTVKWNVETRTVTIEN